MRYLFVSAQLSGHLDWGGFLATAVELQSRGHEVLWASGKEVAHLVQRVGIPFHRLEQTGWRWPPPAPLQPDTTLSAEALHILRAERALDQWLDVDRVGLAVVELLDLCQSFGPDVVVAENFMSSAAILAEVIALPFAVAGWPAFQASLNPKTQIIAELAAKRLASLKEEFNITGVNWTSVGASMLLSPWLHLSYWSSRWFHGVSLLEQTQHVGGYAQEVSSLPLDDPSAMLLNGELVEGELSQQESVMDAPWVFVTLGTSFADDPNFFIAATHAIEQIDAVPIVALAENKEVSNQQLGRKELTQESRADARRVTVEELCERLAPSSIVLDQINFDAVLPSVSAAIHHGGAGTAHALVTHAVPQIVVPHAADQMHQAHGVARSEVGVAIRPQNVTISALAQVLDEMFVASSDFQRNAQRLQAEFAQLGGIKRAADLLERNR